MKMLENILKRAGKIGAGLALAGALVAGPKVDAATNVHVGIAIPGDLTSNVYNVTNGQQITFGVYFVSTNGIALDTLNSNIQLGTNGQSNVTNILQSAYASLGTDASRVVTNPSFYFNGLTLSAGSSILTNISSAFRLTEGVVLQTKTDRIQDYGFAGIWNFTVNCNDTITNNIPITFVTAQGMSNVTSYTLANGLLANDINPGFTIRVAPATIPEPSGLALALWGLGGMFVLNGWKRRK